MKKKVLIAGAVLLFICGLAAYLLWPQSQPLPKPISVPTPPPLPKVEVPKVEAPKTEAPIVAVTPPAPPPQPSLPTLADSDKFMLDALAGLIGNESLMKFFHTDKIIRNIVATVDNLPDIRAPIRLMPVKPAPGKFITEGEENDLTISAKNAARYTSYVKIAEAADAKKLVELYVRLYPLFQQAYEKLGFPKKYFNDRLLVAIDDLLAAPDIKGPIKLVQPNVFYLYADPALEDRSIGQRILIRIGSKNGAIVKAKLREIKKELKLHMHGKKLGVPVNHGFGTTKLGVLPVEIKK
ncbi:MAG: DUF3014 domain-containing protein [Gallionella sp.]|nr:DUF3014 domain-containing protein [Gallionella sp.]MDH4286748.1 DUF3014 domain-containing protein [Gallionella sp.]